MNYLFEPTSASLCQDVMILDQSMLFGVADIHDRHRDMRLDVDNMSYEVIGAKEQMKVLIPNSYERDF